MDKGVLSLVTTSGLSLGITSGGSVVAVGIMKGFGPVEPDFGPVELGFDVFEVELVFDFSEGLLLGWPISLGTDMP